MILLAAIAVATVAACEIALRLPLLAALKRLTGTAARALAVVRSPRISDIWKERILPAYAGRILRASLTLLGCLIAIVAPVVILAGLASGSLAAGSAALMRPGPLAVMLVVGAGYLRLRPRRQRGAA